MQTTEKIYEDCNWETFLATGRVAVPYTGRIHYEDGDGKEWVAEAKDGEIVPGSEKPVPPREFVCTGCGQKTTKIVYVRFAGKVEILLCEECKEKKHLR